MAQISGQASEKVIQIKFWGGLHQNPDGDTKLKAGEAAAMRNFRITRDGNLQRRPGTATILNLGNAPVKGMWSGYVNGKEEMLAACNGKIYRCFDSETGEFIADSIGSMDTTNEVHFFGFGENVYMLNGKEYKVWDGTTFAKVTGYIPLVAVAVPPDGGGELLEQVNKLSAKRRMWISPDGEGKKFLLPETNVKAIDYVLDLKTNTKMDSSKYTVDLAAASVTFTTAPAKAVNSYEIGWTMSADFTAQVASMRYSELYSGSTDTRIFLYGNGSNEAFYSGLDYNGTPRADYFPDLNEVAVGDANTPITAMIRHYSTLVCFKTDSAWSIQFGLTTTADGSQIPGFYVTPSNKSIGNVALGQVRLVLNAPYTLHGNDLYEWRNTSSYSSNLSRDERQAKRISDRIYASLREFEFSKCYCWDDNNSQEYFICYNGKALVCNYAADAWYYYDSFDVSCMVNHRDELYIGSSDGKIKHFAYEHESDDGEAIDAYWESGSMSFGADYMRKYSAQMWVGIKPEDSSSVTVTVITDKKASHSEKLITSAFTTFSNADFSNWSFRVSRRPFMTRLKIKAKKFVFYKLVFKSDELNTTATVLAVDIRVRFTGHAK